MSRNLIHSLEGLEQHQVSWSEPSKFIKFDIEGASIAFFFLSDSCSTNTMVSRLQLRVVSE